MLALNASVARADWRIPRSDAQVTVDGDLSEWRDAPRLELRKGAPEVSSPQGDRYQPDDAAVRIAGRWNDTGIFLALEWRDDVWDARELTLEEPFCRDRRGNRIDCFYFFDYLKFAIRGPDTAKPEFIYTLWLSPKLRDKGPFVWSKLYAGTDRARVDTPKPRVAGSYADGRSLFEVHIPWQTLGDGLTAQIRKRGDFPLMLLLVDGDSPRLGDDKSAELRLRRVKYLVWRESAKLTDE